MWMVGGFDLLFFPFLDWILMCHDPKKLFVLSFPFFTHFRMQLYPPNTICNFHH